MRTCRNAKKLSRRQLPKLKWSWLLSHSWATLFCSYMQCCTIFESERIDLIFEKNVSSYLMPHGLLATPLTVLIILHSLLFLATWSHWQDQTFVALLLGFLLRLTKNSEKVDTLLSYVFISIPVKFIVSGKDFGGRSFQCLLSWPIQA